MVGVAMRVEIFSWSECSRRLKLATLRHALVVFGPVIIPMRRGGGGYPIRETTVVDTPTWSLIGSTRGHERSRILRDTAVLPADSRTDLP